MKALLILLLTFVSYQAFSAGGTSPAVALGAPITLPFYDASDNTAVDNVNTPAGSAAFAAYTTGYDWFYYFCATSTGSVSTTIKYTTSAGGVSPCISVWNGEPGAGGTLVNYITSPGDNTVDGILTCEASVVSGQCYYIMIDNWPTPNGFNYGISIYQSPINAACSNIGFESANKSGWTGSTGNVYAGISTSPYPYYMPTAFATTTTQHTLYTNGNDPLVGAALPRVCPGQGTNSLRLGDGDNAGGYGATIEQRFSVDNSNALFTYYYAVVFEDNGHDAWEQPVFKVEVLDCSGNPITCGDYLVVANAGAAGFTKIPGTSSEYYKSWTPVFLDLTAYIGSCVTVRFTTNDCTLGGHYGYAYIDASCQPLVISGTTSICEGASTTLTAPSGGASYSWKIQGNPTVVGTTQALTVSPTVNTTYQCTITSVAGCQSSLIQPVVVHPLPTITGNTSGCIGNTTQLTGSATADATTPWTSSNTAVATISSTGLITGVSAGIVTITYKNSNGCSKTHSYTVTTAPTITGTLSSCIGQTSQLSGTATADATTPWTSSNTAVATISSTGLVSAVSAGTSTITYFNSNGCTVTATYTVNPNPTISGTLTSCLPGTSQLSGSATANATTPWASGTLATATISSTGLVTAVGIGSSTLTYKNTNGCTITATFNVVATPIITNPGAQTACDSYTLPTIAGSNLSGNQKYYNNSQALNGTVITGPITSTQTVWIYDINGTCSDEESFVVTINKTPIITNPGAQIVCDSYTLPSINGTNLTGNQKYFNNSQALSGTQISGAITTTQTVWIYDAVGSCKDEESFLVTVNQTPTLTNTGTQTVCDSYTLPAISGSNLTGGQKYYNNSQALGGAQISGSLTSTQTVWIYDARGTCKDEESFLVTVNQTPTITNPGVQTVCDSYTLPAISGINLTGNQKYYNNSQALSGVLITGPINTTQTVWIYDAVGNCKDEESFLVTINKSPVITSNPGGLSICTSYTLPTITGTNLTGNQKYYDNSQTLGGTQITGPILSTQTIWIYDNNLGCKDEESFLVTINTTPPSITNPGPQVVCNSYTLPTITGTNLTGSQKYYNNSQALSGTQITGSLTTNQTIWIYDSQGTCSDEVSFSLTVHLSPTITNPGAQTVCDSYTLPIITGTNLSGNQKYYNNSQALGGTVITGPLTSTQTVWIYDINGICSDEESFLVTVNHTPSITNPGAKTVCDSYTLPTITGTNLTGNEKFYNNSQALSGNQITGSITSTQTVWIYDVDGACKDETSFLVTVNYTPSITNPGPQTVCDSYTLPTILGTNLSGNQKFYTNPQAGGGTVIASPITSTQTVWIYDANATCSYETSFIVTVNHTPSLVNPGAQTVCDTYTLPTITGTNLTGNEKFYNNSQALSGTQITGPITSTQTIWLYDAQGACKDEKSFLVTVNNTPSITNPGPQTVCDSYTLPTILGTQLSGNQKYYTNSQALSGTQITGPITSTQTVWIYDASGTCSDEESFSVTINKTPSITQPQNVTICDSYTLPVILGTNLSGNERYYTNSQALGGTPIAGAIITTQTIWLYDNNGACSNEKSFVVSIDYTPSIFNTGNQTVCDTYTLPTITGTNLTGNEKYYSNSQALGGTPITGPITSSQPVWIYDADGACKDEKSFIITINYTPFINNPGNQAVCDSYSLTPITGAHLSGNQKYYNNTQALGGTQITVPITSTQTVWIYDHNGTCSSEISFLVTIYHTPSITNPGNQTVCDSYMLPVIIGTNLTGAQKYYNNTQALNGQAISGSITSTQTIWMYDIDGICPNEKSFIVNIDYTPSINNPGNQTMCDTYTLPTILGSNLTGGQKYYSNSQALSGVQITGPITSTQTIWIYDIDGACKDEKSFNVTINKTPNFSTPGNQTVCDSYSLPTFTGTDLSGNQNYYTNSQTAGGTVLSGPLTQTQTVWMYDVNATCTNEKSFIVTVNNTPSLVNTGNQTVCDSYTLPTITGTNLSGNEKYFNNSKALNGTPINGPITLTQTVWIYDAQGTCSDEESFVVTVNHTPDLSNPGNKTVCDAYLLTPISGTNLTGNEKYFNNSQALGGTPISGLLTTSQTVWIYDIDGACKDEKSFDITVNISPTINFTPDKTNGCIPLTVIFKNTTTPSSDNVTWDFGDGNSFTSSQIKDEITHEFKTADCFDIKLTVTTNGCSSSVTSNDLICAYAIPKASFIVDNEKVSFLNPEVKCINTSLSASSYNWYFGDGNESVEINPTHEFPSEKGTMQIILIAKNSHGCADTTERKIEIYDELIFYIPNTFTPDDDKYNQVFTPIFNAGYDPQNFTMYIFDRWGEIVFETHDSSIGWAGLLGKEEKMKCQDGLYIWKISYKETKTGNTKTVVGDVILIR